MGARVIKTNGDIVQVAPKNGRYFKLDEAQKLVNDIITVVFDNGEEIMIASDNAIEFGFKFNFVASIVASGVLHYETHIFGDVIVCPSSMLR